MTFSCRLPLNHYIMKNITAFFILFISLPVMSQEASRSILPDHSVDAGIIATSLSGGGGFYLEYQHYVNERLSWLIRPGVTGLSLPGDSVCYFLMAGINYRYLDFRYPLQDRSFNGQSFVGLFPLNLEYLRIDVPDQQDPDERISICPTAMIGYSLIFWNRIHLNMQAGGGLSFRLAGEAGKMVMPTLIAGIGLGVRF